MQPCNRIYYSTVHWRLNMFRAAYRSSSGALTVFAASGLHTHVVMGCSQVWMGTGQFPLRLDYGRSPHAYVNQRLQIHLELLMMSGMPLETCRAFNERWNNKFYYKVASCWLFLQSLTDWSEEDKQGEVEVEREHTQSHSSSMVGDSEQVKRQWKRLSLAMDTKFCRMRSCSSGDLRQINFGY